MRRTLSRTAGGALALLAAVMLIAMPRRAIAQDTNPPAVGFTPSGGTYTTSTLSVTIDWCDQESRLISSSRSITLNGVDVTGSFSYASTTQAGCLWHATSTGTITLQSGLNLLDASIDDFYGNTGSNEAGYTYNVAVARVSVSPGSWSPVPGNTTTFSAATYDANNNVLTGRTVTWASSNTGAVTVSPSSGASTTATAVAPGSAAVTATSEGVSGSGSVTVAHPAPTRVDVSPISWSTYPGYSAGYTATAYDANNAVVSNATIAWQTSNGGVVSISSGSGSSMTATAQSAGSATITATATNESGGASGTSGVTVNPPPPVYGVSVTPDGGSNQPTANSSASVQFTVSNTGNIGTTYALAVTCSGAAIASSSCSAPASVSVSPSQAGNVLVNFQTAGSAGATGTITLTASASGVSDNGTYNVTLSAPPPPPASISVDVQSVNAGGAVTRDQCLTIAAGDAAAYECGDLRLVHDLPTTRTMNRDRTPVLLYDSRHAKPIELIAVNVVVSNMTPTSLSATLTISGSTLTKTYGWSSACNGAICRIVFPVNADSLALSTGAYDYTLQVQASNGSTNTSSSASGVLVIVNRATSPFGAGWWLDGLEQLVLTVPSHSSEKLWVGGDGSAHVYVQVGTSNVWTVTPKLDRPDTLTYDPTSTHWRRHLRNGAFVEFDGNGRHVLTSNRQGHVTQFQYTANGLLRAILLPQRGGAQRAYAMYFDSTAGQPYRVDSIIAPSTGGVSRVTKIAYAGAVPERRVQTITDPDAHHIAFAYDGATARVLVRVNRRGDSTSYAYDEGSRLRSVTQQMRRTNEPAIVTSFCASESRTLANCAPGPQPMTKVYSWLDGPRSVADTTIFFVNRFGAPDTVVDALGYRTRIQRDAAWPILAASMTNPIGYRVEAYYSATRALLDSTRGIAPFGAANAVTTYAWDAKWDRATAIVSPTGDSAVVAYDAATGNRLWQRDGRGDSTKVVFGYDSFNMVDSVTYPAVPSNPKPLELIAYDATIGNLSADVTPLGFRTEVYTDSIGRDSVLFTPTDAAQTGTLRQKTTYTYDAMSRVLEQATVGAAVPYTVGPVSGTAGSATLTVSNDYNEEGDLLDAISVGRPALLGSPGSQGSIFVYDAVHRVLKKSEPGSGTDSLIYDPAGNLVKRISARGDTIRLEYDPLNRLTMRLLPADTVPTQIVSDCAGCSSITFPYAPYFGSQFIIPADSASFQYDSAGHLLEADNRDAQVTRTYFPAGAVKADTLRIAVYDRSAFTAGEIFTHHVYGLTYQYDVAGRRTRLTHPAGLCGSCVQRYFYNSRFGGLDSTTIVDAVDTVTFDFQYDASGRPVQQSLAGHNVVESRQYDADGRLISRDVSNVLSDALSYDARGKVTEAVVSSGLNTVGGDAVLAYTGLGALTAQSQSRGTSPIDTMQVDPFGNILLRHRNPGAGEQAGEGRYAFSYGTGGALQETDAQQFDTGSNPPAPTAMDTTFTYYDASGNQLRTTARTSQWQSGSSIWTISSPIVQTKSYYGPDQKLRLYERPRNGSTNDALSVFEEYRYDAFGRRVLTRMRRDSSYAACSGGGTYTCTQPITRYLWDGDQILYELRADGSASRTSAQLEQETGSGNYLGSVDYAHVSGIDQPIALWKSGFTYGIVPHASWNGAFVAGTFTDGTSTENTVVWPGRYQDVYYAPDARFSPPQPTHWLGSLMTGKTDASGLLYMRNRYYDPKSGHFTQPDPIGIAGGINSYGFANADPVTFSDPFGLCPQYAGGDGKTDTAGDCSREVLDNWAAAHVRVNSSTDWNGTSSVLRDAVIRGSIDMNTNFYVSAAKEGGHASHSFHAAGLAVDISRVGDVRLGSMSAEEMYVTGREVIQAITGYIPRSRLAETFSPDFAARIDKRLSSSILDELAASHGDPAHVHISVRY